MATESAIEKQQTGEIAQAEYTRSGRQYRPNVDILESTEKLTVLVDVPGCSADDIDIQFENGELTIHGQVPPRHDEGATYLLQEYGVGDFHRTFQVSEVIDAERIGAECSKGVLTLHLPKVEAAKPRRIEVKVQ
jgi:HSP20 family molecular chaperone IbpA